VVVGGGKVAHDGVALAQFTLLERTASLAISAFGTPFEESNPVPHYPVVDITQAEESSGISKEAMWIIIYVLFSTMKDQETIPISIQKTGNKGEVARYILCSGLGRKHPHPTGDLFLSRAAFWQGAGTSAHNLGWLREYADVVANFPLVDDFTRSDKVIASHPLRPPKPPPGALLYRRYCPHLKQMYELNYIDVDNKDHVQAFHRWHNSERVNKAWGEAGSLETHTEYIKKQMDDPHCWPVLGSWDGDLMGYYELTWVKEDHLSQYIPGGADGYDRGIHIVVGEEKYRGRARAKGWYNSMVHYVFISEPRTRRMMLEPKTENKAVRAISTFAEFHQEIEFEFPYKRSALLVNPRERFFRREALP